ncbi:hypothetical protein [Brevibacillus brevis]|uniref:hypothetical protein n=1 Tax=Brevibacillus brevis TaxID=1393 RepID=UPI000D0FC910|nr:hypothetical protein [Brevibacillus brevis]PSJ63549.1 hypothetical protein C7J99_31315 [Brevibacillus brevis]RED33844.1 hypothetical protein DES34_1029 [Brevibacillus brevis]GEC93335.1 hypothetical protein BBR01nite_56660 [Brevibacillus brevis]VEF92586.1 Uncharacterised protein [Brevibacillus brevis]
MKPDSTEFDTKVSIVAVAAIPFEENTENSAFLPYNLKGANYYDENNDTRAKEYYLSQGTPTHIVRVVLGMSSPSGTLPYVDGTDVYLVVNVEKQTADFMWEEVWAEGAPKFHGGTIPDALKWVRQMTEPFQIQLKDPY